MALSNYSKVFDLGTPWARFFTVGEENESFFGMHRLDAIGNVEVSGENANDLTFYLAIDNQQRMVRW